jgi:hypothetical protein
VSGLPGRSLLAALLVLAAGSWTAAQAPDPTARDESPASEEREDGAGAKRAAALLTSPSALVDDAVARLGWPAASVDAREAAEPQRRAAARRWLGEALAPLLAPACEPVLARLEDSAPPSDDALERWAEAYPRSRPLASAPDAASLLLPERSPALGAEAMELLRASGVLPIEVMLAGEAGRVIGAGHAGPPLRPALLRHARAARLEGVARLAGIVVTLEGGGVDPGDLGAQLLGADRDRVGWNRAELLARVDDPVAEALLDGLVKDGLRWAVYHYLRGGRQGLMAALERPLVGPERLLRPGRPTVRPPDDWPEGGCRLGPRAAWALLLGQDEVPWLDGLVADRFAALDDGSVEVRLLFEGSRVAAEAAAALAEGAPSVKQTGTELLLTWPRGPRGGP